MNGVSCGKTIGGWTKQEMRWGNSKRKKEYYYYVVWIREGRISWMETHPG
jgi:hypothetical protein